MRNVAKTLLSQEQKHAIAAHIHELEKTTTVEYVVGLVDKSSSYIWERAIASLLLLLIFVAPIPGVPHTTEMMLVGVAVTIAFFIAMSHSRWLLRWVVKILHRKQYERKIIRLKARQIYHQRKMDETREKTALFLMISMFEKHIEIICGAKVLSHINIETSNHVRATLAMVLRGKNPEQVKDAVIQMLSFLNDKLAPHFRVVTANPNELDDAVYVE